MHFNNEYIIINKDKSYLLRNRFNSNEIEVDEILGKNLMDLYNNRYLWEEFKINNYIDDIDSLIELDILTKEKSEDYIDIYFPVKTNKLDRLFIELTHNCNMHCEHCYNNSGIGGQELDFFKLKQLIIEAKNSGCYKLHFTGGEPTCHNSFNDIVEFAWKNGFELYINTNGYIKDLKTKGNILNYFTKVNVSLDFYDKTKYEVFRKKKSSFDDVVSFLYDVSKTEIDLRINIMANYKTDEELLKLINFVNEELKATYILENIITKGRASTDDFTYSLDEIKKVVYLNSIQYSNDRINFIPKTIDSTNFNNEFCGVGVEFLYITPTGKYTLCPLSQDKTFGLIGEVSLDQVYKKINDFVTILQSLRPCSKCEKVSLCKGGCLAKNNNISDTDYTYFTDKDMCVSYGVNYEENV